jgi:adenine-specific DNA-methyltransferase
MAKYDDFTKEELLALVQKQDGELASKKYGLVWDAEREPEQVVLDCEHNLPVLKRVKSKALRTDDTEDNILIEGDNYHALTVLNYTHREKIDVIYIDPPYNTGNKDFKYNDRFVDKEDGFRHSKWLNFMEKRLNLAKDLLKKTGVIFISIDDNEQAQLKLLCDKVFGEENFHSSLTWVKRTKSTNSGKAKQMLQQKIEYILVYGKVTIDSFEGYKMLFSEKKKRYPHKGKFGDCRFENLEATDFGRKKRDTMKFSILGVPPRQGRRWQIGLESAEQLVLSGKIELVDGFPMRAVYPEDENDTSFIPFWSHLENTGTAESGKQELGEVVGPDHGFDTVKPTPLIRQILTRFEGNITILDFFAGSGTTAHSILKLNKEDGGNRTFILCTDDENNICNEICYPRLQKVMKGYKKNGDGEKVAGLGGNLQYYKTDLVKQTNNKDQMRLHLTHKCTEMLCVKENIFNLAKEKDDYKIFASNTNNRFLCIYFSMFDESFADFIKEVKKLQGDKKVYVFSADGRVNRKPFARIKDCEVEEIPQKILEVYRQLVKMNIPVKSDTIFLEFEKAQVRIFERKEKDEGARTLRVVLEKTIQKIAQKNGLSIFTDKQKEEKVAVLNDKLKDRSVFTKVQWEENKTYLTIGNNASHGDYSDYDLKHVEAFYRHVQSLFNDFGI